MDIDRQTSTEQVSIIDGMLCGFAIGLFVAVLHCIHVLVSIF